MISLVLTVILQCFARHLDPHLAGEDHLFLGSSALTPQPVIGDIRLTVAHHLAEMIQDNSIVNADLTAVHTRNINMERLLCKDINKISGNVCIIKLRLIFKTK